MSQRMPGARLRATAILLAALGSLPGCDSSPLEPPPPPQAVTVQLVRPERGAIARSVTLPAFRVLAFQEATLYAKVSGYLKTLTVDKGTRVNAGQLIAEIEVPEIAADEAQFKSEVDVAQRNYGRMAEARRRAPDLVVPQTVDELRGQLEIARAKLQRTETLLQYARITAPFTGVVTTRFVDPGAFIPAATAGSSPQTAALVTVMDCTRLRIQVFVPEAEVRFITEGLPAHLIADEIPGREFSGTVTRFAYALDEATKTMLTEIEMPNPSGALRPGMYVRVRLEVERKPDALLVPAAAVFQDKSGTFVLRASDGRARKALVRSGFADGEHVEIIDGISPDEAVVLPGKEPVTDGTAITIAPAAAAGS